MPPIDKSDRDFVGLIVRNQAKLRAFIISLMPGVPGVADVLQETNIVLWEKMKSFEPGTNFTAWAFAIARYEVMAHCRKIHRQQSALSDEKVVAEISAQIETDFSEGDEMIESRIQALHFCLNTLADDEREVIQRRYSEGWSLAGYAREIGTPSSSLRSKLHRIRNGLRKCIAARLTSPPPLS